MATYPGCVYRFLLTPRWLPLHVVVLLVIPAFVFLGQWQFGRYEEKSDYSELVAANLKAPAVPVGTLTGPGAAVRGEDRYRVVTATGTYDPAHELLVRRRTQHGRLGFYVLTPLIVDQHQAVLVNRGWVPAGATADARPEVPAAPAGEVTVTGRLRLDETEETTGIRDRPGLPPAQVLLINSRAIAGGLPYPLLGGYVELVAQRPPVAAAPEPVPEPDVGAGGGLNLAYGVQWWLFIGIVIGGWIFLIRREIQDRRAAAQQADSTPPAADASVSS
jgi:cytochrome oxidase assembly protein ShyY1